MLKKSWACCLELFQNCKTDICLAQTSRQVFESDQTNFTVPYF